MSTGEVRWGTDTLAEDSASYSLTSSPSFFSCSSSAQSFPSRCTSCLGHFELPQFSHKQSHACVHLKAFAHGIPAFRGWPSIPPGKVTPPSKLNPKAPPLKCLPLLLAEIGKTIASLHVVTGSVHLPTGLPCLVGSNPVNGCQVKQGINDF